MNTLTWRLLTAEELTRVYLNEMRRDFPPTELKPLSMVLNSEAVGDSHTWGVYDGETLVAYLLMVRPRGATVSQLDYFAVLPACRAAGLGAKLLAALPGKEAGADAILIEAELPEKSRRPGYGGPPSGVLRPLRGRGYGLDRKAVRGFLVPGADTGRPGAAAHGRGRCLPRAGRLLPPCHRGAQVAAVHRALPPGRNHRPAALSRTQNRTAALCGVPLHLPGRRFLTLYHH